MSTSPDKPDPDLARRLREAMRQQRSRTYRRFWLLFSAIVASIVLVVCWFAWRGFPPPMGVIGFDQVVLAGQAASLRAATEPLDGGEKRWGGQFVFFDDLAGQRHGAVKARTDKYGVAEQEVKLKRHEGVSDIEVRYLDDRIRPQWFAAARMRVFAWPSGCRILAIDIDPTLKSATDWPALAAALAQAQAAGWQIVYLAAKAETPVAYAKEREWLQEQTAAVKDPLVSGPVLARRTLFENQLESAARKAILADLKGEFGGQVYYITANPELMLEPVGDQTGVRLKGWKNLVEILPK